MSPHDQGDGFHGPLMAELPLDGLEAFRLASFNIEYVPQYAPVTWDQHALEAGRIWTWPPKESGFRPVFFTGDKWDI